MEIMTTIQWCIVWILLGLLALALFLLSMPYQARIAAAWDEARLDANAWIGWPLRLLGVQAQASFDAQNVALYALGIRLKTWSLPALIRRRGARRAGTKEAGTGEPAAAPKTGAAVKPNSGRPRHPGARRYMAQMPYKAHALRQVRSWLFLSATLEGRFGFDDPYNTAKLATGLDLVRAVYPEVGQGIEIDYGDAVCRGRLSLSMTVWLPRILAGMAVFLLSREGRTMIRYYWSRPRPTETTA